MNDPKHETPNPEPTPDHAPIDPHAPQPLDPIEENPFDDPVKPPPQPPE